LESQISKAIERPDPRPMAMLVVGGVLAVGLLCGLGVWQLQRLSFKEAVIARIADRIHAPPAPLPEEADWLQLRPDSYDYRRVRVNGTFEHDKEALVFRPHAGTIGYLVLTPLRLPSGAYVVVNRGFIPGDKKEPASRPDSQIGGTVTVTGLMRPPEERNLFTPADTPEKEIWFTRDPGLIAQTYHLSRVAPFSVDADATAAADSLPQGGTTVIDIANNHLSYALTWFGLAIALGLVLGATLYGQARAI
jgi:surfeit locus 1 family protein